ncbi:antirestriction protein [Klebsiella quasipneumoniae subsp. similipneumoniae]|uniref:antirestriction protein n=1 Tax=Klebsiella quasipneumoniae TaxID=1463165 RepID=UPI001FB669EE|nr:antirestriction protein [Klebsiella quasipneumoniae]MCJ1843781.1 antirestriction protein [Klebsiella quasipneumoniae subsp. similipneumoniae]
MLNIQLPESEVVKACRINTREREAFWRVYFGAVPGWERMEAHIFGLMNEICEVYQGAFWKFSKLTNGGAFIWPEMSETSVRMFNPHNGNEAELSPEAAGIAVCLMAYSIWSFKTESPVLLEYFYQLRDYAIQHPEQAQILRLID